MENFTRQQLLPTASNSSQQLAEQQDFRNYDYSISTVPGMAQVEKGSALDYWRLLARRKGLLVALAVAGGLLGGIVSFLQSPTYKARTTIEVQDFNREFMNMKAVTPIDESDSATGQPDLQTELQILQSETLIQSTLDRLGIRSVNQLNPDSSWLAGRRSRTAVPERTLVMEAAQHNLKVSALGQTRILELVFESTNPQIAAQFANTLATQFIDQNTQARWQTSQRTSSWLTQQLDELRANLQRSDDRLQAYARKEGLIYTGDKENISTEKLRQYQTEMSQAQADRILKESRFKIARSSAPDTLPDVLGDNSLRTLQNNIVDLRRQEADLAITFTPDYSKLRRIRAETDALEAAFEHQRSDIVSRITNDYQEAVHREDLLAGVYEKQVGLVMADSQKAIQYDILKRDVDTNRQIYDTMLERVKESGIAAALKPSNMRVIDSALTPEKPFKPNLPLNGAIGMLCGLMIGLVTAVTRDRADRSLNQPGDACRLLGIPELGVIPTGMRNKEVRRTDILEILPKRESAFPDAVHPVVAWQKDATGLADSFRAVLASILFSRGKDGHGALVITSAGPNEGKTTTATNLAVALAMTGHSVLLIDGDIRKPGVHGIFGLDNTAGLTNLLNQTVLDGASADAAIRDSGIKNLKILTSGPALLTGRDLLFSRSMPAILARYRDRYEMILIDTPPMLHMPDARVLGRMSDAAVLVARSGRTLQDAALAASERLRQDHIPVLGLILNDWNPRSSPDSFYGNYRQEVMEKYNTGQNL